jgi:hypothetical protein
VLLHNCSSSVVMCVYVVVLQLKKRRGRCAVCRNREEGEKRTRRQPSPEIGEGGGPPEDFNKDKQFPELGGGPTEAAEWGKASRRPLCGQAAMGTGI